MDDVRIRRGELRDASTLAEFNRSMALETEGLELPPATVERGVRRALEDHRRAIYLVAEVQETVAGSLMVTREWSDWRDGELWWIQSVYVHPGMRRRGIYRLLYARLKEMAGQHPDVRGLRLYVERDNRAAQETYRALGMVETVYRVFEETLV